VKAVVKSCSLSALRGAGVFAAARAATRGRLRVLAYHGVEDRDPAENADGFQVPPAVFARQMEHVARRYRVVALDEVEAAYAGGSALPAGAALITFDDGYRNNASIAAPMLRRMGLPAAFFLTTGFLDRTHLPWWYVLRGWIARVGIEAIGWPNGTLKKRGMTAHEGIARWEQRLKCMSNAQRQEMMNSISTRIGLPVASDIEFMRWDEARRLLAQGFALGAHTVSHPNLGAEEEAVVKSEIETSIARIASETGARVAAFAFPYGRAADIHLAANPILRANGIALGFTTVHGLNRADTPALGLKRLNVSGRHEGLAFEKLMAMSF
jgi:peptidoglycan/xylan/chitin deacetylase (PgdA/CDA1 family)